MRVGALAVPLCFLGAAAALAGGGLFGVPIPVETDTRPADIAIGKIDGGPTKDIAVAHRDGRSVGVIFNEGGGEFSEATILQLNGQVQGVAIADLNGDGRSDIVATEADDKSFVVVFRGKQGGDFAEPKRYRVKSEGRISRVVVADLDRDGKLDALTSEGDDGESLNSAYVLYGKDGGFGKSKRFRVKKGEDDTTFIQDLGIADLDKDGIKDIVVIPFRTLDAWVLWGKGSRQNPKREYKVSHYPAGAGGLNGLDIGDVNRDGRLDILTAATGTDSVYLLRGKSKRGFMAPMTFEVASNPSSVTIGKFNGDNLKDVAVATFSEAYLQVLEGSAVGVLADPDNYPLNPNVIDVEAGQIDGEGGQDLVSALWNNGSVNVLLAAP